MGRKSGKWNSQKNALKGLTDKRSITEMRKAPKRKSFDGIGMESD